VEITRLQSNVGHLVKPAERYSSIIQLGILVTVQSPAQPAANPHPWPAIEKIGKLQFPGCNQVHVGISENNMLIKRTVDAW
jgi:hypothetical protein